MSPHLVRLSELLGCEEDVVHSVQHDGHGLLVLGGHEVAEGAQHASLTLRDYLLQ